MSTELLIVEDNAVERAFALKTAEAAGINALAVENLSQALAAIEEHKPEAILTDLFFEAGGENVETFKDEVLQLVVGYEAEYKEQNKPGPLIKAIDVVNGSGLSREEFVEKAPLPMFQEGATKAEIQRVLRDFSEAQKNIASLGGIIDKTKNGQGLPLGILVRRLAEERNIPVCIVTSVYHHDIAFNPIRGIIGSHYVDTLVDGHKNWRRGLAMIKEINADREIGMR
jgi:CheY-like chemotaxis protein